MHLRHQRAASSRAKLRRSWLALAASRIRSSSSSQVLVELGHDLARPQPPAVGRQALDERGRRVAAARGPSRSPRSHAGPQHLDRDLASVVQRREVHLRDRGARHRRRARSSRTPRRCGRPRRARSSASASSGANGGTRSCSFASSSAMSGGSRSRRVDSTWPNLTKIGPSARAPRAAAGRAARRRRPASTRSTKSPRIARHELVQPEAQADREDAHQPQQPTQAARSASRGARSHRAARASAPASWSSSARRTSSSASRRRRSPQPPRRAAAPRRACHAAKLARRAGDAVRGDVADRARELLLDVPAQVACERAHLGGEPASPSTSTSAAKCSDRARGSRAPRGQGHA